MRHFEFAHNTPEWYEARGGIATSSSFSQIITNKTLKMSSSADGYANELVAEFIMGRATERNFSVYAMEWGHAHESDAINLYSFERNCEITRGGFYTDDDMKIGASPDARVIDKDGNTLGLVEIKCPENPAVHVEYMLMDEMNPKYRAQVQGQLLVSGAEYVDWFSYHPEMPFGCVRIERDEEFIKRLNDCLKEFDGIMQKKLARCVELGIFEEIPVKTIIDPEAVEAPKDVLMAG